MYDTSFFETSGGRKLTNEILSEILNQLEMSNLNKSKKIYIKTITFPLEKGTYSNSDDEVNKILETLDVSDIKVNTIICDNVPYVRYTIFHRY